MTEDAFKALIGISSRVNPDSSGTQGAKLVLVDGFSYQGAADHLGVKRATVYNACKSIEALREKADNYAALAGLPV